jgi:hypothetical protein
MSTTARRPAGARMRLARNISITVCAILLVAFVAYLTGSASAHPSSQSSYGPVTLPTRSVAADFGPLDRGHQIPPDVLGAVVVPARSTVVARTNHDRGVDTYDRSVSYVSPYPLSAIRHFFPAALAHRRWDVVDNTPGLILARHASNYGDYWEIGVAISPRPGHAGSRFTVTLMLFQAEA